MARKKDTQPLLDLKHDFVASLDAHIQECINFGNAVELALRIGAIPEPTNGILRKHLEAFNRTLLREESSQGR